MRSVKCMCGSDTVAAGRAVDIALTGVGTALGRRAMTMAQWTLEHAELVTGATLGVCGV